MIQRKQRLLATLVVATNFLSLTIFLSLTTAVYSQEAENRDSDQTGHDDHGKEDHGKDQSNSDPLIKQLRELQTKVAVLEAALIRGHTDTQSAEGMQMGKGMQMGNEKQMSMGNMSGKGMSGMGGMSMGMGKGMGGMSGMGMGKGMGMGGMSGMGMGMMSGDGMGGMGMNMGNDSKKSMSMMGQNKGMGQMPISALPGFPGGSHIYHIGSTGFFLDHPQHITLSLEQQTTLNSIKEKSMLGQTTFDRWIDAGEQELWVLTSAESPDAAKIEAKVRETEKLRGDKRIAFIRDVGQAAGVLTERQRKTLIGLLPAEHATSSH